MLSLSRLKYLSLILLLDFGFYESKSQNLISNSSFEKYSNLNCTNVAFDDYSVVPSNHVVDNWYSYYSPDYFTSACTNTNTSRGVPINQFGVSYPKHGVAYSGIGVYLTHPTLDIQEYIYQNFTTTLKTDTVYCLSFFVSYSDRAVIAIKSIGAAFSSSMYTTTSTGYINTTPQVINISGFLTDTVNWVEIKGCFTALGGEQYITIGNFNSNFNTDTLHTKTTNPFPSGGSDISYYYIDSVSLWQNNFPTGLKEITKGNSFSVYPNPAKDVLHINLQSFNEKEKLSIKITDVVGKEVFSELYKDQVNISYLEKGIYFLSLYQNSQLIKTQKVVKE